MRNRDTHNWFTKTPREHLTHTGGTLRLVMRLLTASMLIFVVGALPKSRPKSSPPATPRPTFYYERDFANDPTLVASSDQVSVLALQPGTATSLQRHTVRYQLAAATYNFCLRGDPSLATLSVANLSGQAVASASLNNCSEVNLIADTYIITVWHDPSKVVGGKARAVFVQIPLPSVKTTDADGTPKSGYWALQPDADQDPTGARRSGRIHALPTQNMVKSSGSQEVQGMPVAVDWTSAQIDDSALIRFDTPRLYTGDIPLNFYPVENLQDGFDPLLFGNTDSSIPNLLDKIVIDDRADGTIRISATSQTVEPVFLYVNYFHTSPRWAFVADTSFLMFPPLVLVHPPPPNLYARLLFRFFPQSKNLPSPALEAGEVKVLESCSSNADAAVFNRDIVDLGAIASGTAKVAQASAVQLGPNTQVTFYSLPGFTGTSQTLKSNADCQNPPMANIGSLQIRPLVSSFTVSSDCILCELQQVDLSGSVLDGAVLSGTDLSGANLSSTSAAGSTLEDGTLNQANISQAIFDNADMKGTNWFGTDLRTAASFSKIVLNRAAGFAGADLQSINLTSASLREVDFNYTNLTNATLSHADLTGANLVWANLGGAFLNDQAILQKADLTVATLTNANLSGADLTSALLSGTVDANLTGAHVNNAYLLLADLTNATLNNTTFQGTDFTNALYVPANLQAANLFKAIFDRIDFKYFNLTNINLSGASLRNTTFENITCGNTNFSGADLTNATFQQEAPLFTLTGCTFDNATMTKATLGTMLGTATFIGAHMQGAQLTNASLTGANFSKADLTGANFNNAGMSHAASYDGATLDNALGLSGADLSSVQFNNVSLRNTDLSNIKLYGANLNGANLEGSNLSGAYLTNNPPYVNIAASLSSAFLRDVNLSKAQLSGADFSSANFYSSNGVNGSTCTIQNGKTNGCASAQGAVMTNTNFTGAYLFGVDFTGIEGTGAIFTNAVLVGANFDQATLGSDSEASTTTSFDYAFLQGAQLAGASLDHVSFKGAFLDFSSGNTLDIQLPSSNTGFIKYWGPVGKGVCAEPSYSEPTSVPATNSTITCPNGSTNGCGTADPTKTDSAWNNNASIAYANPEASYQNNATYTPASPNPICTDDPYWDVSVDLEPIPKPPSTKPPRPPKPPHPPHPTHPDTNRRSPNHNKKPKGDR